MIRFLLGFLLLHLGLGIAGAEPAPPADKGQIGAQVKCTIRSILASQSPGGIDKNMSFLRHPLSRPPFSAYKSFKLLDTKDIEIPQTSRRQVTLPNGKLLKLTFKERILGKKDRLKLRLHLSITPPKETRFLPGMVYTIANQGSIVVAGDKHQGGILVVAITCNAK